MKCEIIACEFEEMLWGYTCKVNKKEIEPDQMVKFTGVHEDGNTDEDVEFISFGDCDITKVPQGLTCQFPNLKAMQIYGSGLQSVTRMDLIEYKKFKRFSFSDDCIDYFPGDLFVDCKDLEYIYINGNFSTTIAPNIVDDLEKLKTIEIHINTILYESISSSTLITQDDPRLLMIKIKLHEEYNKKLQKERMELLEFKSFFENNESLKDIDIKIDDKQFSVHKSLFAIKSPTIAEIFENNPKADEINLVDISAGVFEHVLKFFYTDKYPEHADFMQLFKAADKLKIEKLRDYSESKIFEELDDENALDVLDLGNKYKNDKMKKRAFEIIKKNYPKTKFEEKWIHDNEKVELIVKCFKKVQEIEKEFSES